MRHNLDQIPTKQLDPIFSDWLGRLQRGKHLEQYRFLDHYYLVPIDGSQYFSSKSISCTGCLRANSKSDTRYYHQILQAVIVHPDMRQVLPLATEPIQNTGGSLELTDKKERRHRYRWVNDVPLNGSKDADQVNFFEYEILLFRDWQHFLNFIHAPPDIYAP